MAVILGKLFRLEALGSTRRSHPSRVFQMAREPAGLSLGLGFMGFACLHRLPEQDSPRPPDKGHSLAPPHTEEAA